MKRLLPALAFVASCRADIVNSFFDAGGNGVQSTLSSGGINTTVVRIFGGSFVIG
jgi:hypothetical protein